MGNCIECNYFKPANSFCATLSEDEMAACLEVVEKMRAEKKKAEEIELAKTNIFIEVNKALYQIGLEETKKILRQINRDLRNMPLEED